MRGAGIEVPNVDMVDRPECERPEAPLVEGVDVQLLRDENGCPRPPADLGEPSPLPWAPVLLRLDMRTRLERVLDTMDLFPAASGTGSTFWSRPLYPDRWEL